MADKLLGIDLTSVSITAEHELGTEVDDPRGGYGTETRSYNTNGIGLGATAQTRYLASGKRYRYVRADAAIAAGDCCKYKLGETDDPWAVVPTAATTDFGFGISEVAVTDQYYFWITIHGFVKNAKVTTGVAAGSMVAPSGTAGRLDVFTFTTTAATLAQLQAGYNAGLAGIMTTVLAASNLADVFIHGG